jgi:hypothetical protein
VLCLRNGVVWLLLLSGCVALFETQPGEASAEIKAVTAAGEYRLGDRDSKEDGIRLATEQAKRHALEQVASYLESITVARNWDITRDEIRSYTAGVVLILDHHATLRLDAEVVVVQVRLKAQVDTDEVVEALAAIKQHEEARKELLALKQEVDQLHVDLDKANQALARATAPAHIHQFSRQREELLNRAQSNAMLAQAWTNWVLLISPLAYPHVRNSEMPPVQALIAMAGQLNPNNPHLGAVQQAVAGRPPTPAQPPAPPVPHTVPLLPRMPTYQIVPRSRPPADRAEDPGPHTLYTWPGSKQQGSGVR